MTDTQFSRRTSNRNSTEMLPVIHTPKTCISYSLVNTDKKDWENLRFKLLELITASIPFTLEKEEGVKRIRLTY